MYASVMPKGYEEPEPDYPLSDSDLINCSSISEEEEAPPVLRIFEIDDLPLHRGDFTSQHAIMVRSRQLSEIAGLMDESTSDQPTLKRFSRYNQSMHSRPPSHMCDLQPGSSYQQQQQQPHTCSKVSSRFKTGFFSGNWTLRSKKEQKMRLSVHDITVVQTEKLSSNSATTAKSSLISSASTFKGIFPQPSQQHYQYHQYSDAMNSTGLSDHTDHPSLIYDHRTSTSSHLRNFKTDKFYGDSVSESMKIPAEIVQTATVPLQFPCTSENFTRFSTTNPSGPPDFVIPVERTIFNEQITTDHRFPVSDLSQQNRFDNFDADQSHPTLNMTMRLKKSESFDDFGHNELHPQLYKNNNDSKLIEFDEIMERNEDCDPIVSTTHTYPTDDIIDNDIDDDDDSEVHRCDESHFGMMRRFGGIKSVGAIRRQWHRPVAEVFPNNTHTRTVNKNTGLRSIASSELTKHISNNSSFTDERFPTSPPSLTHLLIDADSTHRISISESSPSSSSDHPQQQSMLRKSCPDLRIADSNGILSKNMEICRAQNRIRRAHEKKQAALWKKKPIAEWSLDDVLLWLQHLKLDDVASIMIGYDISGRDVERWDNNILEQLGVSTEETRNKILHELRALKLRQTNSSAELNETNGTKSKRGKPMIPLFKLVRSTSYDKVVALETPLTTRDITVAEGRFGCLQVTKVNGANIPLREQDCFLEINELPGQAFRSPLMFTKLVTEAAGEPIRLVVLRRRLLPTTDGVAGCDYDNDTSGRGTFLEKTIQAVDQESSASSGVSSSELSSEVVLLNDDNKSQILRL